MEEPNNEGSDKRKISIRFSRNVRVQSLEKLSQQVSEIAKPGKPEKKITIEEVEQTVPGERTIFEEDVECKFYGSVEQFADYFVEDIIENSINEILKRNPDFTIQPFLRDESFRVEWPTIEEFNINLGREKIDEYLSFWYVAEKWKYNVEFIGMDDDDCSELFKYEAIFGIPARQYPVCQVTASVFFTIEASKIKPKQCNVDVSYYFEGERLIHYPEKYGFQESWLFNIVEGKLKLFKSIKF